MLIHTADMTKTHCFLDFSEEANGRGTAITFLRNRSGAERSAAQASSNYGGCLSVWGVNNILARHLFCLCVCTHWPASRLDQWKGKWKGPWGENEQVASEVNYFLLCYSATTFAFCSVSPTAPGSVVFLKCIIHELFCVGARFHRTPNSE